MICITCREEKPLISFVRNRTKPGGYFNKCKACHAAYMRRWTAKNPNGVGSNARERRRYAVQRADAKRRKIPFLLTFDEWLKIWTDSGHLHESGSYAGQYCMARFGDAGAYEIGNVRICTVEDNHREMRHAERKKAAMRGNTYALGYRHTKETKAKIAAANRARRSQFGNWQVFE